MKESLQPGLEYTHTYRVPENKTVPHLYPESKIFQEMPEVLGAPRWGCGRFKFGPAPGAPTTG